jgi:hypothetical protein
MAFFHRTTHMMEAMMTLNPVSVTIVVSSWTIGMAAVMFPAISPMVLLYNRMISNSYNGNNIEYGINSMFSGARQNVDNHVQNKKDLEHLLSSLFFKSFIQLTKIVNQN